MQHNASEGTVIGHFDTTLGRHSVIDREVKVIIVWEIPGAERALGQLQTALKAISIAICMKTKCGYRVATGWCDF